MKKNTTPAVDAIGEMNFKGNIIPHSWYQHIRLPLGKREQKYNKKCDEPKVKTSGKADHIAIILLSDIIYWYRPTIRRDELTGAVISIEKKFYEDMLQKQYESWGELFGFTKRQTRDAVSRLVSAGLIRREFRNITSKSGMKLNNVMFIEPVIESIKQITFAYTETPTIIEELPPYDVQTTEVSRLNVAPTSFDVDTNTKITTEITTDIISSFSEVSLENNEKDNDDINQKEDNQQHPVVKSFPDNSQTEDIEENVNATSEEPPGNPSETQDNREDLDGGPATSAPAARSFLTMITQFQNAMKNGVKQAALNGMLITLLEQLGVEVKKKNGDYNYSVAGKGWKLKKGQIIDVLYLMHQKKTNGELNSPTGYWHKVLGGK